MPNHKKHHWPALYRLALALESTSELDLTADQGSASVLPMLSQYIKRHPLRGWLKLWLALEEYWECCYYLKSMQKQADAIRTLQNSYLIDQTLNHGYSELALRKRAAWSELSALANQKLLHIAYYETIAEYQVDLETLL
jgi:hypothetical protein